MSENRCICCGKIIPEGRQICLHCGEYDDQQRFKPDALPKVRTNGDRIRAMDDSELAHVLSYIWICHHIIGSCEECLLADAKNCQDDSVREWLQKEASENETDSK